MYKTFGLFVQFNGYLSKRLLIPREPELIKQLTNLRYTISESGASMSIAHSKQYPRDDYCDALMFALLACDELDIEKSSGDLDPEKIKESIKEKGIKIRKAPPMVFFIESNWYDRGSLSMDDEW